MENKKAQKRKIKIHVEQIFRRVVQIISFIFLPFLFSRIFHSMKNVFMAIFHQTVGFVNLIPDITLLLIISLITIFIGRFFCGWLCAFGSMGDAIYAIRRVLFKKTKTIPEKMEKVLKTVKYLLLLGIIAFIWGMQIITIPMGVNPWDLFGMLSSFTNLPTLSILLDGWVVAGILLFGIMIGSFFVERFFCRYLCPLGAYFSLLSRFRLFAISKPRENCGKCTLCTKKCSMGIDLRKVDNVTDGECIHCMECESNCPKDNVKLVISGKSKKYILVGALTCILIVGAFFISNILEKKVLPALGVTSTVVTDVGTIPISNSLWNDGTYEGTANGFRGAIVVQVEITNGVIVDIKILSENEDQEYLSRASAQILPTIISTQSVQVDAVSGATYSSVGLIGAVKDALAKAAKDGGAVSTSDIGVSAADPAVVVGEETMNTTAENTDINTTDNGNVFATLSDIEDGIYEGSGIGFRGNTEVRVTVKDGIISDIEIVSYQDDKPYFDFAVDTILEEIKANQDVHVDTVSGATYTSDGIMKAVADALNLDYTTQTTTEGKGQHKNNSTN